MDDGKRSAAEPRTGVGSVLLARLVVVRSSLAPGLVSVPPGVSPLRDSDHPGSIQRPRAHVGARQARATRALASARARAP